MRDTTSLADEGQANETSEKMNNSMWINIMIINPPRRNIHNWERQRGGERERERAGRHLRPVQMRVDCFVPGAVHEQARAGSVCALSCWCISVWWCVCVSVWVWMCGRYDTRGSEPISKEPPPNPSTTRPSAWGRVWWTGEAHERFILVESLETCTIC